MGLRHLTAEGPPSIMGLHHLTTQDPPSIRGPLPHCTGAYINLGPHRLIAQGPPSIRGLHHLTAQGPPSIRGPTASLHRGLHQLGASTTSLHRSLHQLGAPTTSLHRGLHQLGATTTSLHRGLHLCKSGPGCTTIHLIYRWNNGNIFWVAFWGEAQGKGGRGRGKGARHVRPPAAWGPGQLVLGCPPLVGPEGKITFRR